MIKNPPNARNGAGDGCSPHSRIFHVQSGVKAGGDCWYLDRGQTCLNQMMAREANGWDYEENVKEYRKCMDSC